MRILHTSDWHLGNILHEHHRVAEEIKFFEYKGCTTTIIYIIETEKNKVQYISVIFLLL